MAPEAQSGLTESDFEDARDPVDIWPRFPELAESKLMHEYLTRLTVGRDMNVFVTAASETGVGKTTLAFVLALLWDMNWWTAEKGTLSPREYDAMYDRVRPGSVLILDEAESAVDRRRSNANENVALSQSFAEKRYRQVAGILTAPSKSWVDTRLGSDASDYWIQAQETPDGKPKGEAKVYRLLENEHYETDYKKKTETISWPILDWHPEFKRLQAKKEQKHSGSVEEKYVLRSEYEDLKANYWNKSMKKTRYHIVRAMYAHGISQGDIASILSAAEEVEGISQSRISHLVNADSFDEVYSK